MRLAFSSTVFLAVVLSTQPTMAAQPPAVQATADGPLVFAVPPRESAAKAHEVYGPVADYLSRTTGRQFVLKYTDNWLSYQDDMRKDRYDLVFDGPAFIAWRIDEIRHTPLLRFAPNLKFSLVVKEDNGKMKEPANLAGRGICGFPSPFLPTLLLNELFPNVSRQPVLMRVPTLKAMYDGVVSGKCQAAMLNDAVLKKLDGDSHKVKAIYHSKEVPNQGFTASARIPADVRQKIVQALMSAEGTKVTAVMRQEFGGAPFVAATPKEYAGFAALLKDVWGFSQASK